MFSIKTYKQKQNIYSVLIMPLFAVKIICIIAFAYLHLFYKNFKFFPQNLIPQVALTCYFNVKLDI